MNRQYCASTYCIDFEKQEVLLMYNKKLKKWLQPGGHIEGMELPEETAVRETLEETGIKIKVIGPSFNNKNIEPIAISHYLNKVGDMIDIQYLSIPLTKNIENTEGNKVMWYPLTDLKKSKVIELEIKNKVLYLYEKYKNLLEI